MTDPIPDPEGNAMSKPYPTEVLDPDYDDGTMPENVADLESNVVGHRIVSVDQLVVEGSWRRQPATRITLDNGKAVLLKDTDDCCAYTSVQAFLLHPEMVDHMILGVGTTDEYTTWHIYADLGDILELEVGWSCGNPFYYGYGFDITVQDVEQ
jgi:hypothetical protein